MSCCKGKEQRWAQTKCSRNGALARSWYATLSEDQPNTVGHFSYSPLACVRLPPTRLVQQVRKTPCDIGSQFECTIRLIHRHRLVG